MYSVLVATKCAVIHFIVRPVPLSFLLFALTFTACINVYRSKSVETLARQRLVKLSAKLLLIFIAWTSIHPSFVLGLCVVATAACSGFFESDWKSSSSRKSIAHILFMGCVFSSLATIVNPYGIRIYDALLSTSQWTDNTSEWQQIDVSQPEGVLLLCTLLTIALAYARYPKLRTRISRLEIFFVVVFGAASLFAVRMLPYFGIVAALPLAISWNALGREVLRQKGDASTPVALPCGAPGAGTICTLSLAFVAYAYLTHSLPFFDTAHKRYEPSPRIFPTAALSHLSNMVPADDSRGVLSESNWGGAITWYGAGRLRATIDDRDILFTPQDYKDSVTLLTQATSQTIYEHMAQRRIQYLLVRTGSPIANRVAQDAHFHLMYQDETAVAYSIEGL
jgi:hypothetical protein